MEPEGISASCLGKYPEGLRELQRWDHATSPKVFQDMLEWSCAICASLALSKQTGKWGKEGKGGAESS